jgi:hypothetical protein
MKFIESNHRYKLYNQGFGYIVSFSFRGTKDAALFASLCQSLAEMYGDEKELVMLEGGGHCWKYNQNWRKEISSYAKRKRIYLRNGTDMTMLMLKVE